MSAALIIGIVYIVCGILCFRAKKACILWGTMLSVFGIIGVIGFFLKNETLCFTCVLLSCVFFLLAAAIIHIRAHKKCKLTIPATCISFQSYYSRYVTMYAPVFQYMYQGQQYISQTPNSYSKKKLGNLYQAGQTYDILINPDNPQQCNDRDKLPGATFLFLILAVFIFIFYLIIAF